MCWGKWIYIWYSLTPDRPYKRPLLNDEMLEDMTGWIYTSLWHSKFSPNLRFRTATQIVSQRSQLSLLCCCCSETLVSCFTRRFVLVCRVSLVVGASYRNGKNNVCSTLEAPSLANACGYSREPFYMTALERKLQQEPDLVDPLSCPRASNALIHKVRKHSLSQKA